MVHRMEVIYNGSDKDYESSDEKAQQAWTGECRNRETEKQRDSVWPLAMDEKRHVETEKYPHLTQQFENLL